uniref:Uncharacterized protein n=1 Tax=Romanomermis culicivorax TaxID=13658 RepID=A0A915IQN3_ROMCU
MKRKEKQFGAGTGAKVTGTKIAGAQTVASEMTKSRTGSSKRRRRNGGTEMCLSILNQRSINCPERNLKKHAAREKNQNI